MSRLRYGFDEKGDQPGMSDGMKIATHHEESQFKIVKAIDVSDVPSCARFDAFSKKSNFTAWAKALRDGVAVIVAGHGDTLTHYYDETKWTEI